MKTANAVSNLVSEEVKKKLLAGLDNVIGADQLFGSPIELDGETVTPVAKLTIELSAAAAGGGSGNTGLKSALSHAAKGGGSGDASAGITISVQPLGYISTQSGKPELVVFE